MATVMFAKKRFCGHIPHLIGPEMHVFLNFNISGVLFDGILALNSSLLGSKWYVK